MSRRALSSQKLKRSKEENDKRQRLFKLYIRFLLFNGSFFIIAPLSLHRRIFELPFSFANYLFRPVCKRLPEWWTKWDMTVDEIESNGHYLTFFVFLGRMLSHFSPAVTWALIFIWMWTERVISFYISFSVSCIIYITQWVNFANGIYLKESHKFLLFSLFFNR